MSHTCGEFCCRSLIAFHVLDCRVICYVNFTQQPREHTHLFCPARACGSLLLHGELSATQMDSRVLANLIGGS